MHKQFSIWAIMWKAEEILMDFSVSSQPLDNTVLTLFFHTPSPPLTSPADQHRGPPSGEALPLHSLAGPRCSSVLCLHPSLHPTTCEASLQWQLCTSHSALQVKRGGREGEGRREREREERMRHMYQSCKVIGPINQLLSMYVYLHMYVCIATYFGHIIKLCIRTTYVRSCLGRYIQLRCIPGFLHRCHYS